MKRSLLFFLAATLILAMSCGDKKSKSPNLTGGDTTRIFGVYADTLRSDIMHDVMYRVVNETILVDSGTKKLSWSIDTLYFKPTLDTLRDSTSKKPTLDSLGRVQTTVNWIYTPKYLVWDTGIKVDSALSRFRKYIFKPDSTKKKLAK